MASRLRLLLLVAILSYASGIRTVPVGDRRTFLRGCAVAAGAVVVGASPDVVAARAGEATGVAQDRPLSEALSGFASGAVVSTTKLVFLHPIDTIKTRLQVPGTSRAGLFKELYNGIGPPLVTGAPSGAVFFGVKDFVQAAVNNGLGGNSAQLATLIAVLVAQFPYWGVRTPAEVLKTRSQVKASTVNMWNASKSIIQKDGVMGLYEGYIANIAAAYPADSCKFLVYQQFKTMAKQRKGQPLSTVEAAVLGSAASAIAQAVTTPLDVVRTRIMVDKAYSSVTGGLRKIVSEEGFPALWAGTTPRIGRSLLSGAIQFSSYEFTKGLFSTK